MPGQIITEPINNSSGIIADRDKALNIPAGWNEIDGYEEQWRPNDSNAIRIFQGPWSQRQQFISYMLGYSTNLGAPVGSDLSNPNLGKLSRIIPHQHPEYPWEYARDVLWVRGVGQWNLTNPEVFLLDDAGNPFLDGQGNPVPNPVIFYQDASSGRDFQSCRVALVYKALDYEIRTDKEMTLYNLNEMNRYVSRVETDDLQGLPIPGWFLKWYEGPQQGKTIPDSSIPGLFPTKRVTYTWHEVPDYPQDAFDACVGTVNSVAFDPQITVAGGINVGGYRPAGYPPGTLLMLAPNKRRGRLATGRVAFEIEVNWLYRSQGHNKFPAAGTVTDQQGNPKQTFGFFGASTDGNVPPPPVPPGQPVPPNTLLYSSTDHSKIFVQPSTPVKYQGPLG